MIGYGSDFVIDIHQPQSINCIQKQHHLENLAFASLSEKDLAAHSDQAAVKAFRLAQLTIEYLLHVQVGRIRSLCVGGRGEAFISYTPNKNKILHQDSLAEQLDRVSAQYMCGLRRAAQLKRGVCQVR